MQQKFKTLGVLVLIPLLMCFVGGCAREDAENEIASGASQALKTERNDSVKWHPGNYLTASATGDVQRTLSRYENEPLVIGIQGRYLWRELEPTLGNYNFSQIDSDLQFVRARHRRLVIQFMWRSNLGENCVPNYMLSGTAYHGGQTFQDAKSCVTKIWVPAVSARVQALIQALGARYDADADVEGLLLPETAFNAAHTPSAFADYNVAAYVTELENIMRTSVAAFPHTMTQLQINFLPLGRKQVAALFDSAYRIGFGTVAADILPSGDLPAYAHYETYKNKMALGGIVSFGSMDSASLTQIYDFARSALHVNHLYWTTKNFTQALTVIRQRGAQLNTVLPENL